MTGTRRVRVATAVLAAAALAACGDGGSTGIDGDDSDRTRSCDLDTDLLVSVLPPDAIPSLIEPEMVTLSEPGASYLEDSDRVLGVIIDGSPRAYPHPIMDHHEMVTDRVGSTVLTTTFCPLTGSGVVVDPHLGGERLDLGVSGLLFANNLVYYDRTSGDVFGPQLSFEGTCSRFKEVTLDLHPLVETSWGRWRQLHPNTVVISSDTGFNRNYLQSPYEAYKENDDLGFDMPVDDSRPIKERILGIRTSENGGIGYPFGELETAMGDRGTLHETVGGESTVIFWEAEAGGTAIAFLASVEGQALTFEAEPDGTWTDNETGSVWTLDGRATSGPLAGSQLEARRDAFVAYWFAWRHFQPDSETWTG